MFETQLSPRIAAAQRAAHKERSEVFASLFRAVPKIVSSLRHKS
ncbi:MAG: hypothetical protein AAF700_00455 [Pseudomonadota bacterium]